MSSLATVLNKVQQRFTYRQRFLFFAIIFFLATPLPAYWVWKTLRAQLALKDHEKKGLQNYEILNELPYQITSYNMGEGRNDVSALHARISDGLAAIEQFHQNKDFDELYSIGKGFYPYAPIMPAIDEIQNSLHELLALKTSGSTPEKDILSIQKEIDNQLFDLIIASGIMSDPLLPYAAFLNFTFHAKKTYWDALENDYYKIQQKYRHLNEYTTPAILLVKQFKGSQQPIPEIDLNYLKSLNIKILLHIIDTQKSALLVLYYGFIFLFFVITLAVIIFVFIKVLTKHLLDLLNHIESLAKGDFSTRFYPQSEDEFSQVGLTFNEMANALSDISGRIHSLGIVLAASSEHLTYEVMTHETNIHDQESSISTMGNIASSIALDCQRYVKIISDLSNSALQQPMTQSAQKTLTSLRKTLEEISIDSKNTLNTLQEVQQQLFQAKQHSHLMNKVSEEARMLSFNASIEASISGQQHPQFTKITEAIQQFTDRTTQSTEKIDAILKETSQDILDAESTINECLEEMNAGRDMLNSVDTKLHSIGQQVMLQMEKFEEFNNAMKKQAFEAESIIEAITYIRNNAQAISEIFQQLHAKVQHLGGAARELKHLLEVFFSEPTNPRK